MAIPIDYGRPRTPLVKQKVPTFFSQSGQFSDPYILTKPGVTNPYQNTSKGFSPQGQWPTTVPNTTTTAPPQTQGGGSNQNQTAPNRPFPNLGNLDYSMDPILQNVIAGGDADIASGRAGTLDKQKQLLLAFGSKEMARKLLGNDPFVDTVSDDPYTSMSTLALNKRAEIDNTRNANENVYNPANLFFSSARGQGLADIVRQRVLADATGEKNLQTGLTGLADQFSSLQRQVMSDRRSAEQAAYDRAIQNAIASFYGGGGNEGAVEGGPPQGTVADPNNPGQWIGPSGYIGGTTPQGVSILPSPSFLDEYLRSY